MNYPYEAVFKAQGKTRNAKDGNHATLNELTIELRHGKINAEGFYNEGGIRKPTRWTGTIDNRNNVVFTEIYNGDTASPYLYNGVLDLDSRILWGTYVHPRTGNLGTFKFDLQL